MSVDKSPVYEVKAVPVEKVYANDYNPNVVAPPEMKLLELSIWKMALRCHVYVTTIKMKIIIYWWTATMLYGIENFPTNL